MNLREYPKLKETGIEWLGTVPEHWQLASLKWFARVESGEAPPVDMDRDVGEYPIFGANGVIGFSNQTNVNERSLVVGRVGASGEVNVTPANCWISDNALIVKLNKKKLDFGFAVHLLRFLDLGKWASVNAQPLITGSFLRSRPIAAPPITEQRSIASYLDMKTSLIDSIIVKKQRLIELLQEKRQALISQAVTKGLDPSVPMKDSGIEWLGEIPAHWMIKKLKHWLEFLNWKRVPLSAEHRATLPKIYPYYGASGIIDYVDDYLFDDDLLLIAEDGANLYSRSTPLAFIARGKYWVNNHAHILKPKAGSLSYWCARLNSIKYDPFLTGSAQPKLSMENLGNIYFAAPPPDEQARISRFIDDQNQKFDAIIERLTIQVEYLQEYRQTLISAAVTGKIDLREEVADIERDNLEEVAACQ